MSGMGATEQRHSHIELKKKGGGGSSHLLEYVKENITLKCSSLVLFAVVAEMGWKESWPCVSGGVECRQSQGIATKS